MSVVLALKEQEQDQLQTGFNHFSHSDSASIVIVGH